MRNKNRNDRGGTLAEATAALALFVPILVLIVFVTIQASQAYVISRNMTQGAETAARSLAEEYTSNPAIVTKADQQQAIFYNIRIPKMISSNTQFNIPDNGWQTASDPKTVTVVVTYIPDVGDPPNPAFPNPNVLGLDSTFRISSTATYRLAPNPKPASPAAGGVGSGGGDGGGGGGGKK